MNNDGRLVLIQEIQKNNSCMPCMSMFELQAPIAKTKCVFKFKGCIVTILYAMKMSATC